MSLRLLLVVALALPLAACGPDESTDTTTVVTPPATDDAMADDGMMADDAMTDDGMMADDAMASDVTVDGTIAALEGGITALPVAAATANIDGWIAQLDGAEFEQADAIAGGLRELRTQLAATPIDGAAVGETLRELGEWTTASAAGAASSSQAGLRQLGSTLTSAGQMLEGGSM